MHALAFPVGIRRIIRVGRPQTRLPLQGLQPVTNSDLDISPIIVCMEGRLILCPERIIRVSCHMLGPIFHESLLKPRPLVAREFLGEGTIEGPGRLHPLTDKVARLENLLDVGCQCLRVMMLQAALTTRLSLFLAALASREQLNGCDRSGMHHDKPCLSGRSRCEPEC